MAATSRGIDVSSYQGAQDWKTLAAGGLTFVQVKASEGEHTHDTRYRAHMDGVLSVASLLPGAYHYGWPTQDPHAEADNYIEVVSSDADRHPGFVHWLDLERRTDGANYAGRSSAQIRAYAEAWITRVRAAHPRQRVGCYTSKDDIAAGRYPRNSDALWYPAYPAGAMTYTQAEQRSRPAPGVTPLLWQFTSTPVDRSICYMTPAQLRAWAGAITPEEDPLAGMTRQDIYDAVWRTDRAPAPAGQATKGNPTWWAETMDRDTNERVRALQASLTAQSAAIIALAQQLGKGRDVAAIVTAVQEAIKNEVVRVEVVTDDDTPAAPAKS